MKFEPLVVVFGGILVHFSLGVLFYSQANLTPYIVSFTVMRTRDRELVESFHEDIATALLVAAGTVGNGVTIFIGGYLCRKIGPRPTTFIGCLIVVASVFLTYATIRLSFWAVLVSYGLLVGIGSGLAWIAPLSAAMRWLPGWKGVANGFIVAGFGLGFIFLVPLDVFVNPKSLPPNMTSGEPNIYTDDDILDRVPYLFIILGGISVTLEALGVIFIVDPLPRRCMPSTSSRAHRLWWLVRPRISCQPQCKRLHQLQEDMEHRDSVSETNSLCLEENASRGPLEYSASVNAPPKNDYPSDTTLLKRPGEKNGRTYQSVGTESEVNLSEEQEEEVKEEKELLQTVSIYMPVSLTPKQLLRRLDFYALWFESLCIFQATVLIVAYYHTISAELMLKERNLQITLIAATILDVIGRPIWGVVCDLTSFKTTFVMLFGLVSATLLLLPAFTFLIHELYFVLLCILFFCAGGVAVTLPTGVARWYGLEYAAINYGLLYLGSIIAGFFVVAAVILLPSPGLGVSFGWEGLVCISGGISLLGLLVVLLVKEKKFVLLPKFKQ